MSREHAHDAFFKRVFSRPALAADLLRRKLPAELLAELDLDRLEPVAVEFVDPHLRNRRADLIFRVPLTDPPDRQAYLFLLIEHQSTPDRLMPLRVLTYIVEVWTRHVEQARRRPGQPIRLPAVIPVVVHQGRRPWRSPRSLSELLDLSASLQAILEPYLPRLTLLIDDLAADDDVTRKTELALTAAALLTMRFVRDHDDPSAFAARWAALLAETRGEPHRLTVLDVIVKYLYHNDQRLQAAQLVEAVEAIDDADAKEFLMTLAEQFEQIGLRKGREQGREQGREEGREQGREEGREEGREQGLLTGKADTLLNLVRLKFGPPPTDIVERVRAAGVPELDRWTARILTSETLEGLFVP